MTRLIVFVVFGLAVLLLSWIRPTAGRLFLGFFFLAMGIGVNGSLALTDPESFVRLGTEAPLLEPYRWLFANVVALAPAAFGLLVAAYEVAVGLLLLGAGRQVTWGVTGGVLFLIAITPLGVWTLGNPVLALALAVLTRRRHDEGLPRLLRGRLGQGRGPRASTGA